MGARFGVRTAALAALLALGAGAPAVHAEEGATLSALRLAYQREVNAQWRYFAYSMQARRDAQPEAAALLRAIAHGEAVHAANHRAQLERLGSAVTPEIASVIVRSTPENLADAIAGERRERDEVYRTFAECARRECLYEPLASFDYARGAEATHLALFTAAFERWRQARPEQQLLACAFADPVLALGVPAPVSATWICPGCGSAFAERPAHSCRNCGTAGAAFELVR